jgi:hypothetical protein
MPPEPRASKKQEAASSAEEASSIVHHPGKRPPEGEGEEKQTTKEAMGRRAKEGRSTKGREEQSEELLEHGLGLGSNLRRERLRRSEASLEAISKERGLTARGEREARP